MRNHSYENVFHLQNHFHHIYFHVRLVLRERKTRTRKWAVFFKCFSLKLCLCLNTLLTKCPVYSFENGGFFTRLFVIDYRASLSSGREQAVYLPVMFSLIGITAGIVYWQAETPLQIITAYCGSSIPSILFLGSVLLSRINKSLEVSERHPRTQGLCSP